MGRVKDMLPEERCPAADMLRAPEPSSGLCDDDMLDAALIAYAQAIDVPVLDHEEALRAAIEKVLELRRYREGCARDFGKRF